MKTYKKPSKEIQEFCVRLLKIDYEQNAAINAIEEAGGKVDLAGLRVDLLDLALDMLGVPEDNSIELREKRGHIVAQNDPDLFCRDDFVERWAETKSEDEIRDFVQWVLNQMTHEHN
jgi:hypothetical protein